MKILVNKLFPEELIRLLQTAYWSIRLLLVFQEI